MLVKVSQPKDDNYEVNSISTALCTDVFKVCLVCDKRLVGKYALSKHLRSKHHEGSFQCKECGEVCLSGQLLHEHARKHGSSLQKAYKKPTYFCDIGDCRLQFPTFNAFQSHTLTIHNLFPLECKICKKRYKEQSTFRNHRETHESILKYECDVCQKKFVTRERLLAHRRLHQGKRFQCFAAQPEQCHFKARSSAALRNHIKMKHSERKFQCLTCSKKFASKQNLEQHELIHTGEAKWHCNSCKMAFKRHHHFKAHMNSIGHKKKAKDGGVLTEANSRSPAHFPHSSTYENHRGFGTSSSLVIPLNLEQSFNDEDLIDLADNNSSELFLDDNNVQFIIVNEGNQDVMLMTSNETAGEDSNLMI